MAKIPIQFVTIALAKMIPNRIASWLRLSARSALCIAWATQRRRSGLATYTIIAAKITVSSSIQTV